MFASIVEYRKKREKQLDKKKKNRIIRGVVKFNEDLFD